jgi:hypothetical protein
MRELPIGIFDSGLGGLTVAGEIMRVLPDESVVYLGDTVRCPYGPRTQDEVRSFVLQIGSPGPHLCPGKYSVNSLLKISEPIRAGETTSCALRSFSNLITFHPLCGFSKNGYRSLKVGAYSGVC